MSEDSKSGRPESIGHAGAQCSLGTYHGQVNGILPGKVQQSVHIGILDGHALSERSYSGIARGTENLGDPLRTAKGLDYGVFTAAAADDKDFHINA